uniref:alpha-1,2-Mannosidase n=1 Tax=Panagrellus redivivus TaxID=6233 RepID=A0A7E4VE18_PANRE
MTGPSTFTARRCILSVLLILVIVPVSTVSADPVDGSQNQTAGEPSTENVNSDRIRLKAKVKEMFMHGYGNYMKFAFPHDEILPIACTPRIRDVTVSRGDVDDILGNFSLTLIDSLDTLVVLGELDEFESAIKKLVKYVRFDTDLAVSVFETNIRVVGGLISGHILAKHLQDTQAPRLAWYNDELLHMTVDIADRLLPAFNTTSGLPHPRVNLKHGMQKRLKDQVDTCTACGGTMILEMAALSRLSGNPIYEEKARKAMDFLWAQRNHGSDLVGTVLNVESGNWVRREASIGAGVDSYMEYSLKAYMLLGEDDFLYRFNKHYDAIVRYLSKGPMFVDVHMHRPNVASRPYMDSLSAFWPGLQVLKGDLKSAIEVHEMLYHVVQKYKFLPEAFTHDFQIHWGQHPLRPEFIESTYILYRATRDPHYLQVAEQMLESIEKYTRVACGFAGIKDLRTMEHEDQMDSFVLAETFKYLYMIFSEPSELPFDPDNYILTTEAHFLPLTMGEPRFMVAGLPRRVVIDPDEVIGEETTRKYTSACPNVASQLRTIDELSHFGSTIRNSVKKLLSNVVDTNRGSPTPEEIETCKKTSERLRAWAFSASNVDHVLQLKAMGIEVDLDGNDRIMLTHHGNTKHGGPPVTCILDSSGNGEVYPHSDHFLAFRFFAQLWATSNPAAMTGVTVITVMFCLWMVLLVGGMAAVCLASVAYRVIYKEPPQLNPNPPEHGSTSTSSRSSSASSGSTKTAETSSLRRRRASVDSHESDSE